MEQTDLALAARQQGDEVTALLLFHKAYELESQAANALATELGAEPTRSILFRSAATLALDCSLITEAEKLICKALIGNPPEQVAEELRDLLEQVHFQRHLALRGIELRPEDVQMSIAGKEVGYGIAPMESFLKRVGNTENLIYRTAERKQRKPYRDSGRREKALTDNLQLYITVPRAASFAVTFKVGTSEQLNLPGLSMGEDIIDELLDCLELYKRGEETKLREKINEEAYYRNFVSLARTIEPDGRKVDMVGFTTIRSGTKKEVSLTRTMQDTPTVRPRDVAAVRNNIKEDEETVEVMGLLRFANSLKKTDEIQIVSSGNVRHSVIVPPGMMSDIVKPLWDAQVVVTGVQKGRKIHLMQIRAVDPE
jgi:hypothetical protein